MHKMNTRLKKILFSLCAFAFVCTFHVSCSSDKCKTIVCAYGGTCSGGVCSCPAGYEGTTCANVARNKFLGNWEVFEKGTVTNTAVYPISIVADSLITQVQILNFWNHFKQPIIATVSHDSLIINTQYQAGFTVTGIGYISPGTYYGTYGQLAVQYEIRNDTTSSLYPWTVDDYGYISGDMSNASLWSK
jgi:hypothetical protein